MSDLKLKSKIVDWSRKNLFSSWINTLITCLTAIVVFFIAKGILNFIFNTGRWDVIPANLKLLMVGQYPSGEIWRVWLSLSLVVFLLGVMSGVNYKSFKLVFISLLAIFAVICIVPFLTAATRIWLAVQLALTILGFWVGKSFKHAKKVNLIGWLLSFHSRLEFCCLWDAEANFL